MFISVPKKSGYGYKLKYKEHPEDSGLQVQPPLAHAHSELNTHTKRLDGSTGKEVKRVQQLSVCDNRKLEEWLRKYKYITKETYYKIFSKYCQLKDYKLTDIYDPPLTIKEIKKLRREKRRLYKLKNFRKKPVSVLVNYVKFRLIKYQQNQVRRIRRGVHRAVSTKA